MQTLLVSLRRRGEGHLRLGRENGHSHDLDKVENKRMYMLYQIILNIHHVKMYFIKITGVFVVMMGKVTLM